MTWETNVKQKSIPDEYKLKQFFDSHRMEAEWQYERGSEKKKLHIQGYFILDTERQSQIATLNLFRAYFKNTSGLTLKPVYDMVAIQKYVTKDMLKISNKKRYWASKNLIKPEKDYNINMQEVVYTRPLFILGEHKEEYYKIYTILNSPEKVEKKEKKKEQKDPRDDYSKQI